MARSVRGIALLALLVAAVPARTAAQQVPERFAGRVLAEIRVFIETTPSTNPALLSLIDLPLGQPLSLSAVRLSEERLSQLPQYEDVFVTAEDAADGRVILTFRLEPHHPVDRMEFQFVGDEVVARDELDRRVRERYGGLPTDDRRADVEETVRELLAEEGYRGAVVTIERELRHDPDRATLRFVIAPGPPTIIANVQVNGRSPYAVTEILERTGAVDGAPYRERQIESVLAEIRNELSAKGYYAAIAQQLPQFQPEARVALTLVVEAGPLVELRIDPPNALSSREVDTYIPIQHERAVDADLLDDSKARIINALQREGYVNPTVNYRSESPTPDRMIITFTIDRGRRYRVDRVEAPTGLVVLPAMLVKLLGISSGDVLVPPLVTQGLARIVGEYRSRGFFEVKVEAPFTEIPERSTTAEAWVVIKLDVAEGPQATIASVTFELGDTPAVPAAALQPALQSQPGRAFVEAIVAVDQRRLIEEYARRGFNDAQVLIEREFTEDRRGVALTVRAREGAQLIVQEIIVVGNQRIDTDEVIREMSLQVGSPLSDEARFESRRRLLATSSFRNVTITPESPAPGETKVRVIVSVEEAPATALGYGGGLEVRRRPRGAETGTEDRFEVAPRAFFEIGRRNLGGRSRSVNLFSRVSVQLADAPESPDGGDGGVANFAEYRVTGTYSEQNAFRTDSDLLVSLTSEQAIRTSFNFIRRSANAELLRRLTPALNVSARYALEFNRLFNEQLVGEEQLLVDRVFPQVRLSFFAGGVFWDRRDNPLAPTRGTLAVADHEVALRPIGSEVGFVKSFYQLSFYRPLSSDRRTVLATRAQVGLARGFERTVPDLDEHGDPIVDPDGRPVTRVITDIPASHRFFAGGSTTVRGFQLDRLGSRRVNPDGSINDGGVLNEDGLSNGGHALLLLNLEMRTIVGRLLGRNFAVAGFVDGGNVFARASNLRLDDLRAAVGFGFRYDSPLGPVRLDFGFKRTRLTFARGRERGWEYHLSIGEAF